ncbi:MAG: hypothetical protein QG594_1999, partial [Bacteroidota bacterium]|nr:hypothetical protein [Bacteroidota bacterium]
MLETIDLSIFPKPCYHSPGTVLTLGDLHANPILFIYFLQKNGVISISRQTYLKLYKLYQQIGQQQEFDPNSWNLELQKQYFSFLKLLDELVINPCRIKIRLLGDELADRGECDLFIMLILSQLHDHGIHFSILVSNHGVTFLSSLQYILGEQKLDHHNRMLSDENMRSFLALQKVVFYQVISKNWIKKWLKNVYLPHLELLDYGYSHDSRYFYIFTHAAMGFKQLRALTAEYQIDWKDNDLDALAGTLKNLKNMFRYQKKEELITLFRNNARDPDAKLIQKHLI